MAKLKETLDTAKDTVINAIDANGNGELDIEDVIILGLKVPGIRISREDFLRKEFLKRFPKDIIETAVANTPAQAGIPVEEIDRIADDVIKFERNCVSGISAALGMPGGVAMVATIPVDVAQYYGYMLRATQKLLYLYGFPEIDTTEKGSKFDAETMNILILCMGVMYGAAGANNALRAMAKGLANGISKKIMKTAITKGTLYPIIKSVAKWFSVKMTKDMLCGIVKKSVPVVGGVIGGGITFFSFKPCCDKLKASLQKTLLSNPYLEPDETDDVIIIDDFDENINV